MPLSSLSSPISSIPTANILQLMSEIEALEFSEAKSRSRCFASSLVRCLLDLPAGTKAGWSEPPQPRVLTGLALNPLSSLRTH